MYQVSKNFAKDEATNLQSSWGKFLALHQHEAPVHRQLQIMNHNLPPQLLFDWYS